LTKAHPKLFVSQTNSGRCGERQARLLASGLGFGRKFSPQNEQDDMTREPVFQDPGSLRSVLQRAEARLAAQDRLPDTDLAVIIEKHRGKALPAEITDYLTKHFRGEIRGAKGPKLHPNQPLELL
jgi:hypothetical protein